MLLWRRCQIETEDGVYHLNTVTGSAQWEPPTQEQQLRAAFRKFDADSSGALDQDEVFQALNLLPGITVSKAQSDHLFETMDNAIDKDGQVSSAGETVI